MRKSTLFLRKFKTKLLLTLSFYLICVYAHCQVSNQKDYQLKFSEAQKLINEASYKEGILKLEALLKETPSDTAKIQIYILAALAYRRMGDLEGLSKNLKRIDVSKATSKQRVSLYNLKSFLFAIGNKTDSAIYFTKKSIEIANNLKANTGSLYNNLAYYYRDKGDSFNHLKCIKKAYSEFLKTKDSTEIIYSIYALGDFYATSGQESKAEKYILECLNYQKRTKNPLVVSFDGFSQTYAQILYKFGNYAQSLKYAQAALEIDKKYNEFKGQVYSYKLIAQNYLVLKNIELARINLQKGLSIAEESKYTPSLAFLNTLGGEIEMKRNNYNQAIDYCRKGILYATTVADYELLAKCNKMLIEIYKTQKRFDLALYHTDQYRISNDSLFSSQNRKNTVTLLAQFESEQKDNKILSQQLSLSEQRAKNSKMLLLVLSSAFVALALAVFILYTRYQNKLKVAELLLKMQNDLESFHHQVKESFTKSATEISLLGENTVNAILNKTDAIVNKEKHLSSDEQEFFSNFKYKLNNINEDLQSRINKVKTFSYSISHDLKEPLGQALHLAQKFNYQSSIPVLVEIEEYLKQSNELVEAYTALGEIESFEINLQELNLKDLVMSEIKKIKKLDYFTPDCQINVGELGVVYGDALLVRQLLWNLMCNSIKYRKKEEPCILNIGIYKMTETEVTIHFSDNGIGFPTEFSQRIFTPFARHASAKSHQGFGMGLALCKQIIEKLGGKIWADSDGINGANFYLTFPKVL